ncbi:MAG: prolipoprotein diacylglyceryl transferase [Alphaproteobacteria bacterium]|nr:prolipoprotein diacylglyceryl transferase [Alphaproteobacteria bacterium]
MHPWLQLWGDVRISTYFACIAAGLSIATFVLRREARRAGLRTRDVFDVALLVMPAAFLGARLFVAFESPRAFLADPWLLLAPGVGFVFYGAFLGGAGSMVVLSLLKGLDPWRVLGAVAPAVPMGQAFARLGCLGAGCCHGRPADWPLGITVPWNVRYHTVGALPEPLLAVPLHPSPLYESLGCIGLFVGLTWLHRRERYPGEAFLGLLVGYGALRASLEPFRGDLERGFWFGDHVSTAQLTSAIVVAVALLVHLYRKRTCTPS